MSEEFTGRTVAEAIEAALDGLGLSQDEVNIEILDEGRGGVFGMGAKLARVRVSPASAETPASDDTPTPEAIPIETQPRPVARQNVAAPAPIAAADDDEVLLLSSEWLQTLLDHMGLKARVEAEQLPPSEENDEVVYSLNIEGEDLGILIGRQGETLDAIQYLVRQVVNGKTQSWHTIEVDVERYKQRRERSLQRLAETMADRAVSTQRTVVMEAMPARERRLVHLALRDRTDVTTNSIGEGEHRKVTIIPK